MPGDWRAWSPPDARGEGEFRRRRRRLGRSAV